MQSLFSFTKFDSSEIFQTHKGNEDIEANDSTSMLQKISNNVKSSIEVEPSYKTFFLVISVGIFFVVFSFMFLPFLVVYPKNF